MIAKAKAWYTIFFVLLSCIVFVPAYKYGFTRDFLNWMTKYDSSSFIDFIDCFDYDGLHHLFHLINYSFYRLFGVSHFAYAIFFAILHGINASLIYGFLSKISIPNFNSFLGASAALLFLVSPYQCEVLTWNACMHYLLVTLWFLLSIHTLLKYLDTEKKAFLLIHHVLIFSSFFILEVALASPFIILVLLFFLGNHNNIVYKLKNIFFPQLIFIAIYFFLNKMILGNWVGHYGSDKHLNFSPELLLSNGYQYFVKHISFAHFFPYDLRHRIYGLFNMQIVLLITTILVGVAIFFFLKKYKNLSFNLRLSGIGLIAFFMGIFPIVNLYFYYVVPYVNDRYSYFGLVFFSIFIIYLLGSFPKKIGYPLIIVFLTANLALTVNQIIHIKTASDIQHDMVASFDFCDEDEIYFLTLPENYRGINLFGDYYDDARFFKSSLLYWENKKCKSNFTSVSQVNQMNIEDAFYVKVVKPGKIQVGYSQGGNWFWRHGVGLSNYETDKFKVVQGDWFYNLYIKEPNLNQLFIWHEGTEWKTMRWDASIF